MGARGPSKQPTSCLVSRLRAAPGRCTRLPDVERLVGQQRATAVQSTVATFRDLPAPPRPLRRLLPACGGGDRVLPRLALRPAPSPCVAVQSPDSPRADADPRGRRPTG